MRFADFEVDPAAGVVRRNGERVKLQDLPFRLLVVLISQPGVVLSREELRAQLWGNETFVDAEAGLNTAIAKIRDALGDSAESPRFIETLPKRGYRFVGTLIDQAPPGATPMAEPPPVSPRRGPGLRVMIACLALVGLGVAAYWLFAPSGRITIAVVRFHNETGNAEHDRLAVALTDAVVVALAQDSRYGVIGNSPLLITDRIFADVQRIGTALGAEFVVLGQIQSGDAGLLARGHFIRVSDQKHLWAGAVDLAAAGDRQQQVAATVTAGVALGLSRQ